MKTTYMMYSLSMALVVVLESCGARDADKTPSPERACELACLPGRGTLSTFFNNGHYSCICAPLPCPSGSAR